MRDFTTKFLNKNLIVRCDENFSAQADWLLQTVKQIGEKNGGLKDGETIRLSWTIIKVRETYTEFILCEPDFAGNPFEHIVENVNISLLVLAQQNDVLNKLSITGEPVLFSDKVIYDDDCLSKKRIYLERLGDVSKGDSGWYIGNAEDKSDKSELKALYVYQLLSIRPELLSVLSLPSEYIAIFDADKIEAIVNANNINMWN
jgi:hypothetical protein